MDEMLTTPLKEWSIMFTKLNSCVVLVKAGLIICAFEECYFQYGTITSNGSSNV